MKTYLIYKISRIKMIMLLCCALLFCACTVIFLVAVYPNLYRQWDVEEITVNGEPSPGSAVYYLGKNQYLLRLKIASHPESIYIIDYDKQVVGSPPGNDTGLYFLAGYIYCLYDELRMIPLDGTLAKTDFFNARLTLKRKYCEFTTLKMTTSEGTTFGGDRIHITYQLNKPME